MGQMGKEREKREQEKGGGGESRGEDCVCVKERGKEKGGEEGRERENE